MKIIDNIVDVEKVNKELEKVKSNLIQIQDCIKNLDNSGIKIEVKIDASAFKVQ